MVKTRSFICAVRIVCSFALTTNLTTQT